MYLLTLLVGRMTVVGAHGLYSDSGGFTGWPLAHSEGARGTRKLTAILTATATLTDGRRRTASVLRAATLNSRRTRTHVHGRFQGSLLSPGSQVRILLAAPRFRSQSGRTFALPGELWGQSTAVLTAPAGGPGALATDEVQGMLPRTPTRRAVRRWARSDGPRSGTEVVSSRHGHDCTHRPGDGGGAHGADPG
jgi:hypothetical protein